MLVMLACGLTLLSGLVLAYRWRNCQFALPDWSQHDPRALDRPGLQLGWLLSVGMLTGFAVGVLVIGPGARLVMRLLAATSPQATGHHTEAGFTIGRITLLGTIVFIVAVGAAFGAVVGPIYVFASFALPRGMLGGLLFGALLLVTVGSRIEPLRADNRDFTLVGPSWLAVAAFTTLSIATGATAAALAGRISATLSAPRPVWAWWLVPAALFSVPVFAEVPIAVVIVAVGSLAFVISSSRSPLREGLRHRGRMALRVTLVAVVLVALPTFISAVDDILTVS
jgi:hypothetical protein